MKHRQAKKIEKNAFDTTCTQYKIHTLNAAYRHLGYALHVVATNFGLQHRWFEKGRDAFGYRYGKNPYDLYLKRKKDENR